MNAAIITARAGSKSILDKNVHPVNGIPLVAYPARAALGAERIDRVLDRLGRSSSGSFLEAGWDIIAQKVRAG